MAPNGARKDFARPIQTLPTFWPTWILIVFFVFPQTGLALMGFSRSCPSSLDLLKLVLRGCRGAAGQLVLSDPGPAQLGSSLAQARFLDIWNSGDLEIQKFGIQKIKT